MRTNVDIDDKLMADAMEALGTETKKETIEVALERAIRDWKLRKIRELRGTVRWEGDLMEWRRNRDFIDQDVAE
ncbi:MAG TPA: type II toxin-antitoxin system VapB family antitoxin [Pseudonocardiaceae bacterium]|nr:type II toxin-antitoxin system VapB family antitoxin [Pseudonocardiaceae bacterium]